MKSKIKNVILAVQILFVLLLVSAGEMSAYASFADDTFAESVLAEQTSPKITLDLHSVTLKEALKAVEAQSDYRFMYNNSLVNPEKRVSIQCNAESFVSVLEKLFANSGIDYKIVDNQVVLSAKESSFVENKLSEDKQSDNSRHSVQGIITDDSTGEPIAGVAIVVKGKNTFATTDVDGKYEIECAPGDVLVFSFLGLETVEMPINNRRNLSFSMKQDIIALDNLVVTGYQTISKERATGSFNTVSVEQLNKPQTSVEQALIGNVSGLQIINKGYKDRDESIIIRGLTSLGANSAPLIIVDGFAIEGTLSSLNPNDIANITVLKDAAAASIWGARSANGVIVITTKSAKKGKVNVELNAFVKFSGKMNLDYANPLASSAETIEYEKFAFDTDNFAQGHHISSDTWTWRVYNEYGKNYTQATIAMNENKFGYLSDSELSTTLNKLASQNNKDQIKKYMLSSPITQQYNLTVSGGNEKVSNIFSMMYDKNIGELRGDENGRYTINFRNNIALFKWLDINVGAMVQYDKSKNRGLGLADIQKMSPYDMLVDNNGNYLHVQNNLYLPLVDRYITQKGVQFPYSDWTYNPIREMNGTNIQEENIYGRVQAGLKLKFMEGLTFDSKIQYEIKKYDYRAHYLEDTYKVRFAVNYLSKWNGSPSSTPAQQLANGDALQTSDGDLKAWNIRNQLNFDRTFAGKHNISVIAGTEVYERVYKTSMNPLMYGYNDSNLTFTAPPGGITNYPYNMFDSEDYYEYMTALYYPGTATVKTETCDRYFSLYANASYTYNNKYTLSGSYRVDASNLISSDAAIRYSPFWSVGASWNLSKEAFMQDSDWINRLVLRATYGFNGNVDKSTSIDPLIKAYYFNDKWGTYRGTISNYGNPYLCWEKTGALNIGIDFSVLGNKLSGSIDYYNKQGRDLISKIAVADVFGTSSSQDMNAVEMFNKGIELTLSSNLSKGDFSWNGNLNFSYNKNKITKLYKNSSIQGYRLYGPGSGWEYYEGYDANTLWSLKYGGMMDVAGMYQPVIVDKNGENPIPMTTYYTNLSEDYIIGTGTTVPPYILGFTNTFKYKNLSLSFIITGYFGHKFRATGFNYPMVEYGVAAPNKYYTDVLNANPDNMVTLEKEYPSYFSDYMQFIDCNVQSAANIRFQEINLSYSLPKSVINYVGIAGAQIYGQLNNVGVIAFNKNNEDPFYPIGTYKPGIACTFGVKINF
ncbi:MAG: SusC/RagA family TonB-linked outer membrane protein [Bacteroidales bacterium]|nr:SusC/RagA family TonB-linked outer membrane protein [Bacteroidales bacterium]